MQSLKEPAPGRCAGCIELEKRMDDWEKFFAILRGKTPPARTLARQKAAERWQQEPA